MCRGTAAVLDSPAELAEHVVATSSTKKIIWLDFLFDIPHNIYPKPKDASSMGVVEHCPN